MVFALAAGLLTMGASTSGNAAPVAIAFDDTGTSTTTVNVTGTGGGTMLFSLTVGGSLDLDASNNFSLDVFNTASDLISSVSFIGLSQIAGPFDYGDTTIPPNAPVSDFTFYDVMIWSVLVAPEDLSPLMLNIFSTLTPASSLLKPSLTVEFTGDLRLATIAAPLPGALPLFMTGLAALGLMGWYRKSRAADERRQSAT